MNASDCELSILVARPDVRFMAQTIAHLVKVLQFPFHRRVLVVDTAPLSGKYKRFTDVPSQAALRDCCDELVRRGIMDKVIEIDYSDAFRRRSYRKHFGRDVPISITHDCGGYPVLGSIFPIEQATSRHLLHFDSDMLLYQSPAFNWVDEGIRLLRKYEDVVAVMPLSGPPTQNGMLHQGEFAYERDGRGFFRFKNFTSRCFLIDRSRFEKLLPLNFRRSRNALVNWIPSSVWLSLKASVGRNGLWPWEEMVSSQLMDSPYVRADLDHPGAWTLHPPDHGPEFLARLPEIIKRVEGGTFPGQQAGYYDLRLADWTSG